MTIRRFVLFLVTSISLLGELAAVGDSYLLVEQEFVKFGKKELYESETKSWLQSFSKFTANQPNVICAIYDREASQYLYLTEMNSYADIDKYFQQKQSFKDSFAKEDWDAKAGVHDSTLNFRVRTFHQYIARCSYGVEKGLSVFFEKPFMHYHIYGIAPGDEAFFEKHLQEMAETHRDKKSAATWGVWKVIFDSDTPKYVICVFDKTKKDLDKQVKTLAFVDERMHELMRRDRQGNAEVRSNLSLLTKK